MHKISSQKRIRFRPKLPRMRWELPELSSDEKKTEHPGSLKNCFTTRSFLGGLCMSMSSLEKTIFWRLIWELWSSKKESGASACLTRLSCEERSRCDRFLVCVVKCLKCHEGRPGRHHKNHVDLIVFPQAFVVSMGGLSEPEDQLKPLRPYGWFAILGVSVGHVIMAVVASGSKIPVFIGKDKLGSQGKTGVFKSSCYRRLHAPTWAHGTNSSGTWDHFCSKKNWSAVHLELGPSFFGMGFNFSEPGDQRFE